MLKSILIVWNVLSIVLILNCSHTHNCMIISDPPGAKIKINSEYYGETPCLVKWPFKIPASEITIEVTAKDYIPQTIKVTSETRSLNFVLQPIPKEEHISSPRENGLPLPEEFTPYDMPPVVLNKVEYKYPAKALASGIEGTVWVKALIDKVGKVRDAIIFKDSETKVGFEEVALQGAYEISYTPAYYKDSPVAVWVVYPIEFSIKYRNPLQDTLSGSFKDRK